MCKGFVVVLMTFLFGLPAFAYDRLPGDRYYLINEKAGTAQISPLNSIQFYAAVGATLVGNVNLLNWKEHDRTPPQPTDKYSRRAKFGSWIDFPGDNVCFNTRGLVLARATQSPIQVNAQDPCYVTTGSWYDPYTDQTWTDAKQIQIDHMVPLKEAYVSGAYAWTQKQRCAYTNFMANDFHLIAVSGRANNIKSDQGPDRWMPSNQKYYCQYVGNWLRVKAIWKLMMSESESQAISKIIADYHCDSSAYTISEGELRRQRAAAASIADVCQSISTFPNPSDLSPNY